MIKARMGLAAKLGQTQIMTMIRRSHWIRVESPARRPAGMATVAQ